MDTKSDIQSSSQQQTTPNNQAPKTPIATSVTKPHTPIFFIITGIILILILGIIVYSEKKGMISYYPKTNSYLPNTIPSSSTTSAVPITKNNVTSQLSAYQQKIDKTMNQVNNDIKSTSQSSQNQTTTNSLNGL